MESAKTGILYIIATPIGNLEDITLRAISVLKEVDLILAEDTREADKLSQKYDIKTPIIAYTDQKHQRLYERIVSDLIKGQDLALISDSGTPLISDPGYKLVAHLKKRDIRIVPIPGPSALVTALSVCGLPTDNFIFLGFLPKKKGKRKNLLSRYGNLDATLVLYESSHRIKRLLQEALDALGNRSACLANDLTKKHENIINTDLKNMITLDFKEKGEFVLLIAKEGYNNE